MEHRETVSQPGEGSRREDNTTTRNPIDGENTCNTANTSDPDGAFKCYTKQRPFVGQKCIEDMDTTELVHLVANGVQSILLHSTNESFRRTNFKKLKVRNTEEAVVVFRNKFLQLCGLEMDTSVEDIKLIQEKESESVESLCTSLSLQNSMHSTLNELPLISATQTSPYLHSYSQEEAASLHVPLDTNDGNDYELSLSPSLLQNSFGSINEELWPSKSPLSEELQSLYNNQAVLQSTREADNKSPSLLENLEFPFGSEEIPVFSKNLLENTMASGNGLLNNCLANIESQQTDFFQQCSSRFSQDFNTQELEAKRRLSPDSSGSVGPHKRLTKSELQKALVTKLKVLERLSQDTSSSDSIPPGTDFTRLQK